MSTKIVIPPYQILRRYDTFEIRLYPTQRVAETVVEGERTTALRAGFRILVRYIFGENHSHTKFPMVAPVEQQAEGTIGSAVRGEQKRWKVVFHLPQDFSLESLPPPHDPRIYLREIPEQQMASITFSGFYTEKIHQVKVEELIRLLQKHHYEAQGEPISARYDPPWTLPFLRKNEILIAVKKSISA